MKGSKVPGCERPRSKKLSQGGESVKQCVYNRSFGGFVIYICLKTKTVLAQWTPHKKTFLVGKNVFFFLREFLGFYGNDWWREGYLLMTIFL